MLENDCSYNIAASTRVNRQPNGSGQFLQVLSTWKKVDLLKTFLLLLLVVTVFPLTGKANPLQASLEPKTATVGDPLELTITLPGKEASQIIWPPVSGNLGDFTLLGSDTLDSKKVVNTAALQSSTPWRHTISAGIQPARFTCLSMAIP